MDATDRELILSFVGTYGRGPNIGELIMMREAKASTEMSKDESAQAYAVETITPEGGYMVQGPVPQGGEGEGEGGSLTWEEKEIQRLQKLLMMAIQAIETAWEEGVTAKEKHGRRKGRPENPYKISETDDDPEADDA